MAPLRAASARLAAASAVACAAALAGPAATAAAAEAAAAADGLPSISLRTAGPVADGPKVRARLAVRDRRHPFRGRAAVELRGSSSRAFAKASYALEVRESARSKEGRDVALLGLPAGSDWVLDGAHADATLLRNAVAFRTSRALGRYAPRSRWAHLTLNGRYQGVYVVLERPQLDPRRIAADRRGVQGGYLLELSDRPGDGPVAGPVSGRPYAFVDPGRRDLRPAERRFIDAQLAGMEQALLTGSAPWRAFLDEDAAADHLLLQELFKNQDAFSRSTFLVKPAGGPLALGPLWDMDRAMGDSWAGAGAGPEGWITAGRPFARELLADPAFRAGLAARWARWRADGLGARLAAALDDGARRLRGGVVREARRWPRRRAGAHAAEVARLRSWLAARVAWMDAHVASLGA